MPQQCNLISSIKFPAAQFSREWLTLASSCQTSLTGSCKLKLQNTLLPMLPLTATTHPHTM